MRKTKEKHYWKGGIILVDFDNYSVTCIMTKPWLFFPR